MTTFDRHIIARLTSAFLFLVGALIIFFIVLHYVEYIDDFMDRGATMKQVFLSYYPSYVPEIVRLISPLAIFLAAVYLTGRLAQQLQITALQTSGVSLYRLLAPYLTVAIILTGFMFWFNGWVVPETNRTVLEFERKYLKDAPKQLDISDIHRQNSPGTVVSVGYFDRTSRIGHRASLQRYDTSRRMVARIDAERMEWIDSLSVWRMRDVMLREFDETGMTNLREMTSLDTTLYVYPRDLARTERDVESMTVPDAKDYVESLRRTGAGDLGRLLVAYHSKFSYPFANLILILIAIPLASTRRRGGQTIQIGLGLLTAFAYLAVVKVTEPFGYADVLSPTLAAWLPHALFLSVAVVMLWRVRK